MLPDEGVFILHTKPQFRGLLTVALHVKNSKYLCSVNTVGRKSLFYYESWNTTGWFQPTVKYSSVFSYKYMIMIPS